MKFPAKNNNVPAEVKTKNSSKRLKTRIEGLLKLVVRQTVTRPDSWIRTKLERQSLVWTTESAFLQLPTEVRCNIYDFCNRNTLRTMAASCRQAHHEINPGIGKEIIYSSYSPWNALRKRSFPDADAANTTEKTAMAVYREAENEELALQRGNARIFRRDANESLQLARSCRMADPEFYDDPNIKMMVDERVRRKEADAKMFEKELQKALDLLNDM